MLPAGTTIIREFPNAPTILESLVEAKPIIPKTGVFLPDDYRPDRVFPLLVFLQGGAGGDGASPGEARRIAGRRGWICVNMPLFKHRIAPLAKDKGNYWQRMFLVDADANRMWRGYAEMLTWVFTLVPNIDRSRCCLGGFSNGAHTTAILLNRKARNLKAFFTHFLFVEGGVGLKKQSTLKGLPMLMLQGADWDKPWLTPAHRAAKQAQADIRFETMRGVSHAFPPAARKRVKRWLVATQR